MTAERLIRRVRSTRTTASVPRSIRAACASAEEKAFVEVRCPQVVPRGTTDASVLLPRRSTLRGPDAPGDAGRLRYRSSRRLYVLELETASLGHWMVGGGQPAALRRQAMPGPACGSRRRRSPRLLGTVVDVVECPPYPAGGIHGRHVIARASQSGMDFFASVHGGRHEDLAIALLVSMLRDGLRTE